MRRCNSLTSGIIGRSLLETVELEAERFVKNLPHGSLVALGQLEKQILGGGLVEVVNWWVDALGAKSFDLEPRAALLQVVPAGCRLPSSPRFEPAHEAVHRDAIPAVARVADVLL